jgi:hypothetical protein
MRAILPVFLYQWCAAGLAGFLLFNQSAGFLSGRKGSADRVAAIYFLLK